MIRTVPVEVIENLYQSRSVSVLRRPVCHAPVGLIVDALLHVFEASLDVFTYVAVRWFVALTILAGWFRAPPSDHLLQV